MDMKAKWIRLIFTVATGSRKVRMILTPVVGLSYFLLASLFAVLALVLDRWLEAPPFPPLPLNLYAGLPLCAAGLSLVCWCVINFLRVKGTPVPFNPPPVLVTSGPYAYVRNPMLGGIFILLFGLGAVLQSIFLMLVFTPLFILINVLEIKMIEEPELEMRLGKAYREYKKKTPMFFPKP